MPEGKEKTWDRLSMTTVMHAAEEKESTDRSQHHEISQMLSRSKLDHQGEGIKTYPAVHDSSATVVRPTACRKADNQKQKAASALM